MVALLNDPHLQRQLMRRRRAWGADRYDEVWDGVYVMNAYPNIEHQGLVGRLTSILLFLIDDQKLARLDRPKLDFHPGRRPAVSRVQDVSR